MLTSHPAWETLSIQSESLPHLRELFAADPDRAAKFQLEAAGLFLDYSKNLITSETVACLIDLANAADLRGKIDAMFRGDKINITENRAVLHTALRAPRTASIKVDGVDVVPESEIYVTRDMDFSVSTVLATDVQQQQFTNAMRMDLSLQILRRIAAAAKPRAPAPTGAKPVMGKP
jgi:glucose-6-phosphate isomerase